jgi:hypothetical protein
LSKPPTKFTTRLEGHSADITALTAVSEFSEIKIVEVNEGEFIIESPLNCDPVPYSGGLRVDAQCEADYLNNSVLPMMTTFSELQNPRKWFGLVTVSSSIKDDQGNIVIGGSVATAYGNALAPTISGQAAHDDYAGLFSDFDIQDALQFFAMGLTDNWTGNFSKAFELITLDVGQKRSGTTGTSSMKELKKLHDIGRDAIADSQGLMWVSKADTDRFVNSLNRRDSSGKAARHALSTGIPDPNPMSKSDATQFLRGLLAVWMRNRGNLPQSP